MVRDFFLGRVEAADLARDLENAFTRTGRDSSRLNMRDLDASFAVTAAHLIRLCDAVLADLIPAQSLEAIGFGLIASDHFEWDGENPDGERVAEALYDWSSPEINYPLTKGNVAKFRHRLLTGEDTFVRADWAAPSA